MLDPVTAVGVPTGTVAACSRNISHVGLICHGLDHLDPNLPLRDVAQDLHSTGPTQETCAAEDHADQTAPTRRRELNRTDQ